MDVSKGLSSVIWTLVAIFAFFREGKGQIECYHCNSIEHTTCESASSSTPIQPDCKYCAKIVDTLKGIEEMTVTNRLCMTKGAAGNDDKEDIHKSLSYIRTTCTGSKCNSALPLISSFRLVHLLVLSLSVVCLRQL